MKSPKETALETKILDALEGYPLPVALAKQLFADEETHHIQDYANIVSIRRLGFNDHGPVHMRQVAYNAIKALCILHKAGVKTSLSMAASPFSVRSSTRISTLRPPSAGWT